MIGSPEAGVRSDGGGQGAPLPGAPLGPCPGFGSLIGLPSSLAAAPMLRERTRRSGYLCPPRSGAGHAGVAHGTMMTGQSARCAQVADTDNPRNSDNRPR